MKDPVSNHPDQVDRVPAGPAKVPGGRRARRGRWRRWTLAIGATLLVLVALLPWMTSGPRLARLIAERISVATRLPIGIADAQWGWWKGVVLKDIRLDPDSQTGVQLKQVTIQANVWDLLADKTVRQIRLSDVTVDLAIAPEAAALTQPVAPATRRARKDAPHAKSADKPVARPAIPPASFPASKPDVATMPVAINQIVLDRCQVNLRDPVSGAAVKVFLPAATIELDRKTGVLNWRLSVKVGDSGGLASEGRFVLPRLAVGPADLRGSLNLAWNDLSLQVLPAGILGRLGLAGLGGTVNGSLNLQMSQDWTMTYDLASSAKSLLVQPVKGNPVFVSQAAAGIAGQWQMIEQQVRVQKAWAQLPGADLTSVEPALIYDGQANHIVQSNASCKVTNAQALRSAIEQLGISVPVDLELAGGGGIEVHVGREEAATVAWLAVSGEALAGSFAGYYRHPAGQPLALNVACRLWDDGSLELQNIGLDLPGGRVRVAAHLSAQPGAFGRQVAFRDSQLRLEWDNYDTLIAQVPMLPRLLAPLAQVSGPGALHVQASAAPQGVRTTLSLNLPADARVATADGWLDKPAGQDLRLDMAARLSSRYDWLAVDQVRVATGEQSLVQLQDLKVTANRRLERGKPLLWLDLKGALEGLNVTGLGRFSPKLAEILGRVGAGGALQGRTSLNCWADLGARSLRMLGVQASAELGMDDLALSIEGGLRKRAGERLRLAGSFAYQWNEDGRFGRGYGSASMESQGLSCQAWYENSPGSPGAQQWAWGWLDVHDVDRAVEMLPALAEVTKRDSVAGRMQGRWQWTRHRDTFDLDCDLDLTGIRYNRAFLRMNKPAGLPERLELAVSGPAAGAAGEKARHWRVPKVRFVLGQSYAGITDAEVEISEPWARLLAGQGREAVHSIDFTWPIHRASGKIAGTTVFGEVLGSVSQELGELLDKYRAAGPVPWTVDWDYSFDNGIGFAARADAADLALHADMLDKAPGVPLEVSAKGRAQICQDARNQLMLSLNVTEAKGQAASLKWSGQSQAERRRTNGQWQPKTIKVSGKVDCPQVEQVAGLFEPVRPWQVQGHIAAEGAAAFAEQVGWKVEDLDIGLWPVTCIWPVGDQSGGMPCRGMGLVNLADHTLAGTGLETQFGRTQGRVTFEGTLEGDALRGQVGTAFSRLDVDELVRFVKQIRPAEKSATVKGRDTTSGSKTLLVSGQAGRHSDNPEDSQKDLPEDGAMNDALAINWAKSNLKFIGSADRLVASLEEGQPPVTLNALGWWGSLENEALAVDFAGAFQGGPLSADIRRESGTAPLKVHYRAERIDSTEVTRHMVVKGFPGMTVGDGPITLDETLTIDLLRPLPAPLSTGELIVEGGIVRGAAAPKWVTRAFPGLQLASFKFSRMHNWYERDASGRTTNRIIFRGSPWSMYMNGWSQTDGKMRYEIGVDLLGPVESEYWATADRGRLPLFNKTGQVIDGKLHDEVVSFLGPQQIGERILKDNLLTISYHAIRQQVLRGQPAPSDREVLSPASQQK